MSLACGAAVAGAAAQPAELVEGVPAPRPEDALTIALAPELAVLRHTDLYRKQAAGDARALGDWRALKPAERVLALRRVTQYGPAALRVQALQDLRGLTLEEDPDGLALPALVDAALRDPEPEVQRAAVKEILARQDERAPKLAAARLRAKEPEERRRAVDLLKAIGGPRVYEAIIEHWRESWGPGPRGHMVVARQQSYIGDYEISGDSYDPVVKQFMVGVVLDVKSLGATADHYIVTLLRDVTGQDLGNDLKVWRNWWDLERPKFDAALQAGPPDKEHPVVIPVEKKR